MLRRLRWILPLAVVLVWPASSALAASPVRDRDYAGVITEHAGGHTYRFPISFHISEDGRTAGPIELDKGVPASRRCAMGPLGTPYSGLAHIAHGRFSIHEDLYLPAPNNHGLGYVVVSGSFAPHGRFSGTLANRTSATICQTTVKFTARLVPKPAKPVRKKQQCLDSRDDQWVTARFRFRERSQTIQEEEPAGIPPIVHTLVDRERTFATISIGAVSCLVPHKGWRLFNMINVRPHSGGLTNDPDHGVEPRGSDPVRGWGIGVEAVHDGVMRVRATACTKDDLWSHVHKLLGFPLPVKHYAIPLAEWVVEKFVVPEDGVKCADLGTVLLVIRADRHGRLSVRDRNSTLYGIIQETEPDRNGFVQRNSRLIDEIDISRGR